MRKKNLRLKKTPSGRWGEVLGILLMGMSAFVFLGLISYTPLDISFHTAHPHDPPYNYVGLMGAWFSFFAFFILGLAAFLIPLLMGVMGFQGFWRPLARKWWVSFSWMLIALISGSCLLELQAQVYLYSSARHFGLAQMSPGGILGQWILRRALIKWIGKEGSYILLYSLFLAAVVFLLELKLSEIGRGVWTHVSNFFLKWPQKILKFLAFLKNRALAFRTSQNLKRNEIPVIRIGRRVIPSKKETEEENKTILSLERRKTPVEEKKVEKEKPKSGEEKIQLELISSCGYQLPPLKLLEDGVAPVSQEIGTEDLERNAEILKTTLAEFGVEVDVVDITKGPVITRYELQPAPGVKVQKITALSNDIALAMKATSVRMVAPIPGKAAVGVEVPNSTSTMVTLKELLTSEEFRSARKKIPLALGKDVSGLPIVADLSEMPHLLIAGATGSGKSICLGSIILNILFYATPDHVRFLMIDPKMIELSVFNQIPHLVIPVITEPRKAAAGLGWLVTEMERRYKVFAEMGVRNIEGFNERVRKEEVILQAQDTPLQPFPYIVVVIDELADLMTVVSHEVENSIARLAQLSRAVGIHLILATQRPSVDVITGVIKANFPARISFQVSSRVDSRTVLDTIGADKLLGKGDMLFMPPGSSKLIRAQGAYLRDAEIKRVLEFIKAQNVPSSPEPTAEEIIEKAQSSNMDLNLLDDESLLEEAIQIIRLTQQASVSILQRKLRIGYSRAARIMDLLEERGIVGPYKGSKARDILIDAEVGE